MGTATTISAASRPVPKTAKPASKPQLNKLSTSTQKPTSPKPHSNTSTKTLSNPAKTPVSARTPQSTVSKKSPVTKSPTAVKTPVSAVSKKSTPVKSPVHSVTPKSATAKSVVKTSTPIRSKSTVATKAKPAQQSSGIISQGKGFVHKVNTGNGNWLNQAVQKPIGLLGDKAARVFDAGGEYIASYGPWASGIVSKYTLMATNVFNDGHGATLHHTGNTTTPHRPSAKNPLGLSG